MPGFSVNVGANVAPLTKGLNQAKQELQSFSKTATTSLTNIAPGANQATNALTALSRGVQDLPFGAAGFANNIEGIIGGFSQMAKQAGGAKEAFKALGASLLGGGGLMLAIGAVSTAMTLSSQGFFTAKTAAKEFEKALEDANKQAGEEIARVQVLNAVITDNTRTQKDRKSAAKELSDILKDLNIKLSQEAILNGQVEEATKKATEAIISRAKARAAEARIGELAGQQLQRDLKRQQLTDKLNAAEKKYQEQLANRGKNRSKDEIEAAGLDQFNSISAIGAIRKSINDLNQETEKANKEIAFLIGQIKTNDPNVEFGKGSEKDLDPLKQRIAALKEIQSLQGLDAKQRVELVQLEIKLINRDGPKLGFSPAEIKQQSDALLEKAFPVKTFEYETVITTRVNKLEISTVKDAKALTDGFKTDIAKAVGIGDTIEIPAPKLAFTNLDTEATKALNQARDVINGVLKDMQVEIVAGFAEAFGTALTGGDVGNVFNNMFKLIADGLIQLGKALIGYGIAMKGFKIALSSLNPGVALVAGFGAVAAGVALKAAVPKFATGGIVSGPIIGQIGEMHRPEVIMPLDRLPQMLRSIGGGGGNDMQLIPIINNEGLYLAMKRGERRAGRKI